MKYVKIETDILVCPELSSCQAKRRKVKDLTTISVPMHPFATSALANTLSTFQCNILTNVVNLKTGRPIVSAYISQYLYPLHRVYCPMKTKTKNGFQCVCSRVPPQFHARNDMLDL